MKCDCSVPRHPWKHGKSTGSQPSSSGCALPHQAFPHSHWLTSSHRIHLTHQTKMHPEMKTNTQSHHLLVPGPFTPACVLQKKGSNPNSCLPSPFTSEDPAGYQECKARSWRHNNLWHTGSSQARKALFQPRQPVLDGQAERAAVPN